MKVNTTDLVFTLIFSVAALFIFDEALFVHLISSLNDFFSTEFMKLLFPTFVGAATACLLSVIVEWWRSQSCLLAEINAAKIVLMGYISNVYIFRERQALPQKLDLDEAKALYLKNTKINSISLNVAQMNASHFESSADIPISLIAKYNSKDSDCLSFLIRSKEAINTIISINDRRNEEIREIMKLPDQDARFYAVTGIPDRGGFESAIVSQATEGVLSSSEYALYFLHEALEGLDLVAKQNLKIMRDRVLILPELSAEIRDGIKEIVSRKSKQYYGNV